MLLHQLSEEGETIHPRHLEVENHDIRDAQGNLLDRFERVAGSGLNHDVPVRREHDT
jgi:hypothetical protein